MATIGKILLQVILTALIDEAARAAKRKLKKSLSWVAVPDAPSGRVQAYVSGLLLDGERKSIEPMAARLVDSERDTEAMRQRLQQCVSVSTWADDEVRRRLALTLQSELPGIEALVVDDTGIPKKGAYSVGVARQ